MKPTIEVCLTPLLLPEIELKGKAVVVIDVLRATSTICTILANGASAVIPVPDMAAAKQYEGPGYILAAERQGRKVEGFNFGNSPLEYSQERISGKTIVLTTTNGTRAVELSREAKYITAGSFLNMNSLNNWLQEQRLPVVLFCAGWKNNFNLEDTLLAGAMVRQLKYHFDTDNDASLAAEYLYLQVKDDILSHMKKASHYKRLHDLGIDQDMEYCFQENILDVVPVLQGNALVAAN